MKDVVEVKFEVDTSMSARQNGSSVRDIWKCPVTNDTLGPGSKAVYLVPCGHAFSGTAMKEVSGEKCLQCNQSYAPNDVITIIPTSEIDIARLSLRMKTLKEQGLTHSLKKASKESKKRKKRDEQAETTPVVMANGKTETNGTTPRTSTPKPGDKDDATNGAIHNASTKSLTAKVLAEQEERKRRKMENENVRSLFSSRDPAKPHGKSSDFMTRGFSIPVNAKR